MTLDSEIVAAFEAGPHEHEVRAAIRDVRARLVAEHVGEVALAPTFGDEGLVAHLDSLAASGSSRLRKHAIARSEPGVLAKAVAEVLDPWDGEDELAASSSRHASG
jgi:hypothetical protein